MTIWNRIYEYLCPCFVKKENVFLEEIIVEESCEVLREVVVEN